MNNLTVTQQNLPDNLEDLSKFVLIGREKLTSVRASIRAIDKLQLAEDVWEQKQEEAQMLGEALLDAEVKIGDLLKQIPKAQGKRTDITSMHQCEQVNDENSYSQSYEKSKETKQEVITRLGFSKDQANRFETLSSNKDLVEQVKAEARENEDIPTRSRVFQLIKEKSKEEQEFEKECKELDKAHAIYCKINDAVYKPISVEITEENVEYWLEDMTPKELQDEERNIERAIENLKEIKRILQNHKMIRRVK